MFMEIARTVSKRSTCHRLNVGCVVVYENRVMSIGYNGPPSGHDHCKGTSCPLSESGGCTSSIHAEKNAIDFISKHFPGILNSCILYVTHSPCSSCADLIESVGIRKVVYESAYRIDDPIKKLVNNQVQVSRYTPSGYLFDHLTGQVSDNDHY